MNIFLVCCCYFLLLLLVERTTSTLLKHIEDAVKCADVAKGVKSAHKISVIGD